LRGNPLGNGLVCVGASAVLELVPAIGMGILFPLFVHLTHASATKVGSAVGNIYAWNTLGSIVGASLTAIILFPRIGTSGAVALATAMYVVSVLAIIPWKGATNLARLAATTAVGATAVALVARPTDPRLTNLGLYLYGDSFHGPNGEDTRRLMKTLFFQDGASSSVFVAHRYPNSITLRVNGKVDASNGLDMGTQTGAAYFPRLFKPDAKEVLIIGFGSGCTSGRSLLFPGTHVTCCELEPAVYAASEQFGKLNSRPHEKTRAAIEARNAELPPEQRLTPEQIDKEARFSIIFGDGRTALQGSGKKFDIVSSEPSNPWIAGVSNLFTREFFRSAREHLTDGGVLAQWIQTYNFTLKDYLMIVRTMRSEFSYYGVIELSSGSDTLLLASNKPLVPNLERLARLQKVVDATPTIKTDFESWFGSADLRWALLSSYMLGKEQLDQLVDKDRSTVLNTDLNLQLEFDAPLHLFRKLDQKELVNFSVYHALRDRWTSQLAKHLGLQPDTPELYSKLGDCAFRQGTVCLTVIPQVYYWQKAARAYQTALNLHENDAGALRGLERARLRLDVKANRADPEAVLRKLIELEPHDAVAHSELATLLLHASKRQEAAKHYREALRIQPDVSFDTRTYTWANNLAWLLATSPDGELRNGTEAVHWAERACDVAADADPEVLDTLAAALAEAGRYQEAIQQSKRLIGRSLERPDFVEKVKARIKLYEASKPYRDG
jgi:spermidine synthase